MAAEHSDGRPPVVPVRRENASDGSGGATTKATAPVTASVAIRDDSAAAAPPPSHAVQFRVMSHSGVRHALKLERIFWELLEAAASSARERPGAYVARLISGASGDQNKTSLLRTHCADWLRRKLVELSAQSIGRQSLRSIVLAAPGPCFVVNAKNAIEWQNEPLIRLLQSLTDADIAKPAIRITFQSGIETLRTSFREKPSARLSDVVTLHVGDRTSRHRATIAMLESINSQPAGLLVYLEPRN